MKLTLNPLCRRDHKSVPFKKTRVLLRAGEEIELPDQDAYALLAADSELIDASKLTKSVAKKRSSKKVAAKPVEEKVKTELADSEKLDVGF